MDFLDKLFGILSQLIDLVFSSPKLVIVTVAIIFITMIYKLGVKAGSKKKPPEFKVKAKDSYTLEEFMNK